MIFVWCNFIAIVIGFVIGAIVKRYCNVVYKGPSSTKIQKQYIKDERTGQWYHFVPEPHVCPPSVNIYEFDHSDDESE